MGRVSVAGLACTSVSALYPLSPPSSFSLFLSLPVPLFLSRALLSVCLSFKVTVRTSLVLQWLELHACPLQGAQVKSLLRFNRECHVGNL